MICCNRELKTPFCPHCGAAATTIHPAAELLKFLRRREASSKANMEFRQKRIGEIEGDDLDTRQALHIREQTAYRDMSKRRMEQYGAWANAVEELIRICGENAFVESNVVGITAARAAGKEE